MFNIMKCMESSFFINIFNNGQKKKRGRGKGQPRLLKFVENIRKLPLPLKRAVCLNL